jgi:hypothetical protein
MYCKIHGKNAPHRTIKKEKCAPSYVCRLCECDRSKKFRLNNILESKLNSSRSRRTWEIEIDQFYLEDLLLKQGNKCALSGVTFSDLFLPSIDRIDSTKGYIKGNIQLVLFEINKMKMDLPQSLFILLCNYVSQTHPEP